MAKTKMTRGQAQDRAKVAGGQDHEFRYEATMNKTSKSAVKSAGNDRKRVEAEITSPR